MGMVWDRKKLIQEWLGMDQNSAWKQMGMEVNGAGTGGMGLKSPPHLVNKVNSVPTILFYAT